MDEDVLLLEPRDRFDAALIGIVRRFNSSFALYSESKVLEILAEDAEADGDEDPETSALEHYEFNIVGGWVGEGTPAFLMDES